MSVEIKVPAVGESITEGVLSRWLKKNGELVRADEPVVELETEKATPEWQAPAPGKRITTVAEGQTVSIGTVIGRIEEADMPAASESATKEPGGDGLQKKQAAVVMKTPAPVLKAAALAPPPGPTFAETPLSPAARRLAEETGMNVGQITPTGRGGLITKEDLLTHL